MGLLVNGEWKDQWYDTKKHGGEFVRESAQLRDWVGAQQAAEGDSYPAEEDRYHLYVSLACPWAHRTLIMRKLKGLEPLMGTSHVSPLMLDQGWTYRQDEGASGDPINGVDFHHQLYTKTDPHYTGRVTVPVLWDKQRSAIVNNESADLLRMFNHAFDMIHVDGFSHARPLVDFTHVIRKLGIIFNTLEIAFEMAVIHRIKTYQCGK